MKVLLLNQCFYPDVVATAQQLTSLAVALQERGHQVTVIASSSGYDDPTKKFPVHENWNGIEIIRVSTLGLGKQAKWRRAASFLSFLLLCSWRLMLLPRQDVVVGLTSPPLIAVLGVLFTRFKGGEFFFWVMDLNPDEAIAAGWLKPRSLVGRSLQWFLRYSLRRSTRVIALDRFMKQRIEEKGIPPEHIEVIPPWPFDDLVRFDAIGRAQFREQHGLAEKFVIMHAGNHSPCHPLDTLMRAAQQLCSDPQIVFCFVGGGSELQRIREFAQTNHLSNVRFFPYQPLESLAAVLSAADLHVAVMGAAFVGIVHPSKIYNVLSVGVPILYIGPSHSSIADVAAQVNDGSLFYQADHGDVSTVIAHVRKAAGERWLGPISSTFETLYSKRTQLPRLIALLEATEAARASTLRMEPISN